MKKLSAILLVFIMTLSLASCSFFSFDGFDIDAGWNSEQDDDNGNGEQNLEKTYVYNDFSPAEKKVFLDYVGEVIPFVSNNEYAVEGYYEETDYENGVNFYTVGNTEEEFQAYRARLTGYTYVSTYQDGDGDTWYKYEKGSITLEISYYEYEGKNYIDVYVTAEGSEDGDQTGGNTDTAHTYTDFTAAEKQLFTQYIGAIIPFLPCDEYYVEGYYEKTDYENGICFITVGNTETEYNEYRATGYSGYKFEETYVDEEYGDTWYCYSKDGVAVDMTYYENEGETYTEIYVCSDLGGDSGSGSGSGSTDTAGTEVITNKNKGLPPSDTGVYSVDFTDATGVKDVTDQGYYIDGCPTVGSPAVLVIPVQFSDAQASSRGYSIGVIEDAFKKDGNVDYYSVYDYYYISSYGQLTLDVTVLSDWFQPSNPSSYYANLKDSDDYFIGDQAILNEALAYLEPLMDLSAFDSDNNGVIDSVVMINTLDVGEDNFYWAYRYWNYYANDQSYYYEYDGVSANDYVWASYQFIHESYEGESAVYTDTTVRNTYTYIHEFAHILGADDYYDTAYVAHPMEGADMMDAMTGDHNAYTKFNYGWIKNSRLVVTDTDVTLELEAFANAGDTIIIANNFDPALGVYQEYYVLMYYTNTGLNAGDEYGYFSRDGIVVYHVNASLYKEIYEGETYFDIYNNNTDSSDQSGTADNLIEYVKSAADTYTYVVGDAMPEGVTDDNGQTLGYTFTVDALTEDKATITFTKK